MLSVIKVEKRFGRGRNAVRAVKSVCMDISAGERVYIHGRSGAGKSTLLHMMGGLMRPTEGNVVFRGEDLYKMGEAKRSRQRNRSFGFVFQFYHLLPELTVLENVMLPAIISRGIGTRRIRQRAEGLLDAVEMTGRLRHRPSEISGGEAQRTAIARALINSPAMLFCDEPTGNMDSVMSGVIYGMLQGLSEEENMSVVIVSHQDVPDGFVDKEYMMKDGELAPVGDVCPKEGDTKVPAGRSE
ncbi:MAG: ABC transporter ATP-binding protein [Candidatus Omnitrophica bacterium]|nr:ABC transporter ATP-binding protein [Candidatus Omnitrophota bacterium]MDD5487657.1 ABC transporter ATP-binding protein [Candidatus Omnitrophota bacterium]